MDKKQKRLAAAQTALREAQKAIERAGHHGYPPHEAACLAAAREHTNTAARLLACS